MIEPTVAELYNKDSLAIEEIILPEHKREESLQEISLSTSLFSDAEIESTFLNKFKYMKQFTANLNLSNQSWANNSATIIGIREAFTSVPPS